MHRTPVLVDPDPRLLDALRWGASLCAGEARLIRSRLPDEDGAPDAPPRKTTDGLWEADAEEYDDDAKLLRSLLSRLGGET